MLSNSSKMLYQDAQEVLIGDVKVAKKAWIEPVQCQRIDHTFEFQVTISVAKEPCILDAVIFTTIVPTTDDHDDDDENLSHHLNDLVKGVIERETMEEIFRVTNKFINHNHQAVAVFGNVQLELKHLGRLILYDAYIYVKPQFVDVSGSLYHMFIAADEDSTRTRQTEKVLLNVQADQLREAAAFPSQVSDILLPGHVLRLLKLFLSAARSYAVRPRHDAPLASDAADQSVLLIINN